jgi:hypothetical protein
LDKESTGGRDHALVFYARENLYSHKDLLEIEIAPMIRLSKQPLWKLMRLGCLNKRTWTLEN